MPIEGYTTITVPEEVKKDLKERAEKEGLSVPRLIETYMTHATHINELLWLDQTRDVQLRIEQIAREIAEVIKTRRIKERAKESRVKGEEPSPYTFDEANQLQKESYDLAREIAEAIIERSKELYEEFKKKVEEDNLKYHLSQSSHEAKDVKKDHEGRLVSVTYKTNAEVVHEKLLGVSNRVKELFGRKASQTEIGKNFLEVSNLMAQWNDLKKYVHYLSDEDKKMDSEIAKILGV